LPLLITAIALAIAGYFFWHRDREAKQKAMAEKENEQEVQSGLGAGEDYNVAINKIMGNGRSDGFQQAGQTSGNADAFDAAVKTFFAASLTRIAMLQNAAKKWRERKEGIICGLMAEINQKDEQNALLNNEKNETDNEIDDLKNENIKLENPSKPQQTPNGNERLKFKIFVFLLISTVLFLWIFYNSVIYSAFFKTFQLSDLGVVSSIFDAKALTQSWKLGLGAVLFTYLFPLVILGISSIVHIFKKNKVGMFAVYSIAFVFDALLAYEISEKIYNLKAENAFADIAPFSLSLAFTSITFWLIIFLGFVVYIIAGFIFEYTLNLHETLLNPNTNQIKQNKNAIALKEKRIEQLKNENKANDDFSNEKRKEIAKIRAEIGGGMPIPHNVIDTIINSFSQGWIQFLSGVNKNHPLIPQIRNLAENYIGQIKNDKSMRIKEQTFLDQNNHLQIEAHNDGGER
jgi:hypothetical protein